MVYLLICTSVVAGYTTLAHQDTIESSNGYSYYFSDTSAARVILQKKDGSFISDEELDQLSLMENINFVVKDDVLIDSSINIYSDDFYFWGSAQDIRLLDSVDVGRLPENDYEIVLYGNENDYYYTEGKDVVLNQSFHFYDNFTGGKLFEEQAKVVGLVLYSLDENPTYRDRAYVSETILEKIRQSTYKQYSKITSKFLNIESLSEPWSYYNQIIPSKRVPKGYVYVSEDYTYSCPKGKCANQSFTITAENLYYTNVLKLRVKGTYNKKNMYSRTGFGDYAMYNGAFFVNFEDYNSLFSNQSYQSSVYVKDIRQMDVTLESLDTLGYKTLRVQDHLVNANDGYDQIAKILLVCVYIVMGVVLFFISYFIIQLIYRSRNIYYSTIRILGANKIIAKQLLTIELFVVSNLAYALVYGGIYAIMNGYIEINKLVNFVSYLETKDFVILYIVICIISLLISHKYGNKLFEKSAMDTYRQEV